MQRPRFVTRIRVLVAVCVLVALVVVVRLYMLQIVQGDLYLARAEAQTTTLSSPLLLRDSIYFRDKDGNLVIAATTANSASSSNATARYYPGQSLAAQEIGFVAYNNDNTQKGRYGLERYYEQTLAREEELSYSNFFVELFGAAAKVFGRVSQTGDLVTTLEPVVQGELERTLQDYNAAWTPQLAGGIVMDPHTGEIVAMAVYPTFDLNAFNKEEDPLIFANPLVENVYEMGSIMKPLTMAVGLDSGAITSNTTYYDTGEITLDGKTIRNHDGKARGTIPMQQVLSQSLNLGASFIAMQAGKDTMRDYFLNKFKLGNETGIDLPGELHGLVENLQSPRQVEYSTAAFGQGIAVTPIQMARALATLGNDGMLVTPHLVRSIRYDTGLTEELSWGQGERAMSEKTAREVSRMLTEVVDTALLEGKIKFEHYSVAAKTGTAQIANPQGGGYYEDRFLHSFFGYFPSYDARFIVFLFAVEPQGAPFSSQTFAWPFYNLTQFLISYYDIPPDR
ncbi:MAG: penicillin-binding protein 2 [Candidatus Adlerbacteria bacterium]|nr:penicillin-binding protein 2 [Candidatus Adlerbacteria bacterium]MDZ4226244.1 penicillin-binding protein 2 [Patescibacteria group bacterium]